MTTLTTNLSANDDQPGFFTRIGQALVQSLERHAHVASRRDQIEALEAKSDAELDAMGLRRADIVHHVFQDLYYA